MPATRPVRRSTRLAAQTTNSDENQLPAPPTNRKKRSNKGPWKPAIKSGASGQASSEKKPKLKSKASAATDNVIEPLLTPTPEPARPRTPTAASNGRRTRHTPGPYTRSDTRPLLPRVTPEGSMFFHFGYDRPLSMCSKNAWDEADKWFEEANQRDPDAFHVYIFNRKHLLI